MRGLMSLRIQPALLQVFACQLCGALAIAYPLPTMLDAARQVSGREGGVKFPVPELLTCYQQAFGGIMKIAMSAAPNERLTVLQQLLPAVTLVGGQVATWMLANPALS